MYIPHLIIDENYTEFFIHVVSDFQFSRVMQLVGSMENIYLVTMETMIIPFLLTHTSLEFNINPLKKGSKDEIRSSPL